MVKLGATALLCFPTRGRLGDSRSGKSEGGRGLSGDVDEAGCRGGLSIISVPISAASSEPDAHTRSQSNGMIHAVLICKFSTQSYNFKLLISNFETSQYLWGLATHKVLHDSAEVAATVGREDLLAGLSPISSVMQLS